MTYTDLKTKVAEYFGRSDLATKIPGWIELAESFLFREISPNTIETKATGVTTGTIALPTDFSRFIRLDLDYSGQVETLDYSVQGSGFVVEGSTIRLVNKPDTSFTYSLYYSPKLTALSGSNATNWMLDNGYDLYFTATVMQGALALKNDAELARSQALMPSLIDSVRAYAGRSKLPQSGSLQIKVRGAL